MTQPITEHQETDRRARPGLDRGRILRFPLIWMTIGVAAVGLVAGITAGGPLIGVIGAAAAIVAYLVVMRFVAGRRVPELSPRLWSEALRGAAMGAGFVVVSAALAAIFGGYTFQAADGDVVTIIATTLAVALTAAVTEELLFRGLALQALESLWGSRIALGITALAFGALHLGNPGASLWSGLAISIEAGVLMGAAFLWRRNLWFPIGLHMAWNATESLLGIPVSGHAADGLFTVEVSGPDLLTGGRFGLEGSIVPVLVSTVLAGAMLVLAHRRGRLRRLRGNASPAPSSTGLGSPNALAR